jgi:hypothetical protein
VSVNAAPDVEELAALHARAVAANLACQAAEDAYFSGYGPPTGSLAQGAAWRRALGLADAAWDAFWRADALAHLGRELEAAMPAGPGR